MRRLAIALVGAMMLSLTACATGAPLADPTPSSSSRPPFATSTRGPLTPAVPSGTPAKVPDARWDAIVADLESRGVTGEPVLVSAEAVTWPNGALGCPQPGASYTQALVEGMRVVVEVDGTTYDYRFGRSDTPALCGA